MIKDMILKNRTYRRFYEDVEVEMETLREFVELARLSSSGANLQSIKYILCNSKEDNKMVYEQLKWAGYLKEWKGPSEGERPSAYVIMLQDKSISNNYFWDHGIAAQSILLGATEKGLGGCMFGALNKDGLSKYFCLEDRYEVIMTIAIGKPKEVVVLEEMKDDGDVKYWRDEEGVHHVPKRKLDDLIISR